MNIIYLDSLFFINWVADYFALLCAGKISGAVLSRIKISIAAAAGGLYACSCTVPALQWLMHPAVKLAYAVFLCLISFGSEPQLLRCCITFLAVSAAFGGVFTALSLTEGAVVYLPIHFKTLVLSFAIIYFLLSTIYRRYGKTQCREFHEAVIAFMGNTVRFTVLKDSGNELYDPVTNAPVMVCQQNLLTPLFPQIDLSSCQSNPYALFELLCLTDTYAGKTRLIPFQAVSGKGVMVAFKPNLILIDGQPQQLIVALTDKTLSHNNTYQGIY